MSEKLSLLNDLRETEVHLRKRLGYIRPNQFNTLNEFYEIRTKLRKEFEEVTRKRANLEHERDIQQKAEKIANTKAFLEQNINLLVVEKDHTKLSINKEKLSVRVPFTNCKHVRDFPLESLVPFENERLWRDIINGTPIKIQRNCGQCKKEKKGLRAKFGRWNDRPIGSTLLIVRGLC